MPRKSGGEAKSSARRHWPASIRLRFNRAKGDSRTRLAECTHSGPLRVQRLFHPDPDGKAHCYLLHPPGGVAPGDELLMQARVDSGAALLTTPSAGRFYRIGNTGVGQRQVQELEVASGALLEWLPQETLLFDGAEAQLHTRITLENEAALAFWDILVLGRPASGERFRRGEVDQRLRVSCGERLALDERLQLTAGDRMQHGRAGLGGASTIGTALFRVVAERELCTDWLRERCAERERGRFGLTQRGEFLIARYLGEDAALCRAAFSSLWQRVQARARGLSPSEPRIWHT